jgi:hypothetical protein
MIPKVIAALAFCLTASLGLKAQTEKKFVIGELPSYKVARATSPITVDGKMTEDAWKNAEVRSLDYFYRGDKPVDKQATKFRMMWDDTNLYLLYECQDTSLTARETAFDARPYLDDCAEFFVIPVPDSLNMHFGFEINITKAAYDYMMFWQYYQKRNFFVKGYNPAYRVEVTYDGTINDEKDKDKGWTMELAKWAFQAVRQDRNLVADRFRSTSTLYPIYDIKLDVHQPNRFGLMEFMSTDIGAKK